MRLYDFRCNDCDAIAERLVRTLEETPACGCGSSNTERMMPRTTTFSTIIADYPGAKRRKAGYAHSHADRPKEKISVSVLSNVSKD